MVDLLPMYRTGKVLIQGNQCTEAALTEIASIPGPIPGGRGSNCGRARAVIMPADLLVGEDMIGVDFTAVLIDLAAIDTRRAGSGFEMQAYASEIGELVGAPGALDILSCVD